MVKKIITEISEEDFRKLDLRVYRTERIDTERVHKYSMVEVSLNDIVDKEIEDLMYSGYESDYENLQIPLTIAIHEPYTEKDYEKVRKTFNGLNEYECRDYCLRACSYLDKFMNMFTGAQTYQLGWGIRHLYSTRDYYESHEDYWKVRKDETKVIYRIKLADHWLKEFVLKHKSVYEDWNYNELPDKVSSDYIEAKLNIHYDVKNGKAIEVGRIGIFKYKNSTIYVPVDNEGHEIFPAWKSK